MKIQKIDNVAFSSKPNQCQMQVYTSSLSEGLNLLGKQVDLILHNASAPAIKNENTGIGSLFSRTVQTKLLPFLKAHVIKGIQQEPNNLRKAGDNSPYAPESNAKNIFMIPLEKLASKEYGNLLSKKTFDKIVKANPSKDNVDYTYVRKMYDIALKEAFTKGKDSKEFAEFKSQREKDFEQSAIFRVLARIHNSDDFNRWNIRDRQLFIKPEAPKSKIRISGIKQIYKDEYDYFLFQQMLIEKENKKSNELAKETGINIIGDSPVAPSAMETWVNQKLFLKGQSIGCPPDYFSASGQRWGFPYYNPDKIFNKDGSLGEAGEVLKKKYEEYFASFPGGIRIDHVIGLIDPFIYTNASKDMTSQNSGRIYSIFSGKYRKNSIDEYAALLTKIIIPAAEKHGLTKSDIICEDLGDFNKPTIDVMKKLGLSGLFVTQFDHRGADAPEKNVIMLGSHDNASFIEFTDDLFNYSGDKDKKNRFMRKTNRLANDTAPKGATKEEKRAYLNELRKDKSKFIAASFAELFTSPAKRIQIFFSDFWGLGKTYNRPGTTEGNWSLRLGENFEDDYYKAAAEGRAPNLPQAVATALRQRGLDKGNEKLMKNLDESARIIAEV